MRSFYQVAFLALPLFTAARAAGPKEVEAPKAIYASAQEAFQDLLNALPEESLHAALSGLNDFKNGIFESHHQGVENIHNKNPALATKLIVDAVNDLRKRLAPTNGTSSATDNNLNPSQSPSSTPPPTSQNSSPPAQTSSAASTPPQSSAPSPSTVVQTQTQTQTQQETKTAVQTSTERPAVISVESTVTKNGKTIVQTTEVLSQVTASVVVTLTRTNQQGSTVTETENRPAVIKTTTDQAGRTTVTTSAVDYAPTAGQVQTKTDPHGSVVLTTYTPGGGLVSSIKLITTTDAVGRQSTMTTYAFVDPVQATATSKDNPPSDNKPSLQTAAAVKNVAQFAAVGLGAMAFFF